MPVLTETPHKGQFILSEDDTGRLSRDVITIASGAGKLKPGTVIGQVTASSKWVPSPASGSDGSQVAKAVLIDEVDATSADVKSTSIARHAEVNVTMLYFDASVNTDALKSAKYDQLRTAGIVAR